MTITLTDILYFILSLVAISDTVNKLLVILFCILFSVSYASPPTLQTKLYYTCKVWGYTKYFHSEVSTCKVNWDSVLLRFLPVIKSVGTSDEFNDLLDSILIAAGPMTIATTPQPPILPDELTRNLKLDWFNDTELRADISSKLNFIRTNFRPHKSCWVSVHDYSSTKYGYLIFHKDDPILNINTTVDYPDHNYRLLMFFEYWNIVNYFNPYNYVLNKPWDSTLYNHVIAIDTVGGSHELFLEILKIAHTLNDAHADLETTSRVYIDPPGFYLPNLQLRNIENQYTVVNSGISGICKGDILKSIDNKSVSQWVDSLKQYFSFGSDAVLHRIMNWKLLARETRNIDVNILLEDSSGNMKSFNTKSDHYPTIVEKGYIPSVDSLRKIEWTTMPCDVGYVNVANMRDFMVNKMYNELNNKQAIIFDLRMGVQSTFISIADVFFHKPTQFAKLSLPDINYPGTYYWEQQIIGKGSNIPYEGKVIILVNEQTQSAGEFYAMMLRAMPNAVVVGSQTAGADGNVTFFNLTQDLVAGFTSLGVYYPNGDSTQRVGIVPDVEVKLTRKGIIQGKDEALEAALKEAGCFPVNIQTEYHRGQFNLFPNPTTGKIWVTWNEAQGSPIKIIVRDIYGNTVLVLNPENNSLHCLIDLSEKGNGTYILELFQENHKSFNKVLKLN